MFLLKDKLGFSLGVFFTSFFRFSLLLFFLKFLEGGIWIYTIERSKSYIYTIGSTCH
jgi:hypothetical protein